VDRQTAVLGTCLFDRGYDLSFPLLRITTPHGPHEAFMTASTYLQGGEEEKKEEGKEVKREESTENSNDRPLVVPYWQSS